MQYYVVLAMINRSLFQIGGLVLNRIDARLYLACMFMLFALCTFGIPLCRSYVSLIAVSCINGVAMGAIDTGTCCYYLHLLMTPLLLGLNVTALKLWGWKGAKHMQTFHFLFAVGTILSPFVAGPFISKIEHKNVNSTYHYNSDCGNGNATKSYDENNSANATCLNETVKTPSQIIVPFSIVAAAFVFSTILFTATYIRSTKKTKVGKKFAADTQKDKLKTSICYRILLDITMFFRFGLIVGLEVAYSSLVMTYAVDGLGWDRERGLGLNIAYRGSFSAARAANIFLTAFLSPSYMVVGDVILILASLLLLCFTVHLHVSILWIGTSALGIGMASFYGASMSWVDRYLDVDGKDGAVYLTGCQAGIMIIPAMAGYLFENISPNWFLYICCTVSVLLLIAVLCGILLVYRYNPSTISQPEDEMSNQKDAIEMKFENGSLLQH